MQLHHDSQDQEIKKQNNYLVPTYNFDCEEQNKDYPKKTRMSTKEIQSCLIYAIRLNKSVIIQIEFVDSTGNYLADIIGKIEDYDTLGMFIKKQKIAYDEIRNISFELLKE